MLFFCLLYPPHQEKKIVYETRYIYGNDMELHLFLLFFFSSIFSIGSRQRYYYLLQWGSFSVARGLCKNKNKSQLNIIIFYISADTAQKNALERNISAQTHTHTHMVTANRNEKRYREM